MKAIFKQRIPEVLCISPTPSSDGVVWVSLLHTMLHTHTQFTVAASSHDVALGQGGTVWLYISHSKPLSSLLGRSSGNAVMRSDIV